MTAVGFLGRPRVHLRWLLDSSLVGATWVAILLGAWAMARVGCALRMAEAVRVESDHELARLVAEAAVARVPLDAPEGGVWRHRIGDCDVTVELGEDHVFVTSRLPTGEIHDFRAAVLPGASPPVFGRSKADVVPPPDDAALTGAAKAEDLSAFRQDSGVALMYFDGGTDLDDFVIEDQRFDARSNSVIVVPGHLWVERSDKPLALYCERDVTVVIRGNLYVGRSIRVAGPGRVVFATVAGEAALPFADRDGNGRCSSSEAPEARMGAIEGAGSVYLGLADPRARLEVGASLVMAGYLHLRADTFVAGSVVSAHSPVAIRPGVGLTLTGLRLFRPERELVPGFAVAGPARVGLLFEAGARSRPRPGQALYLTPPAR